MTSQWTTPTFEFIETPQYVALRPYESQDERMMSHIQALRVLEKFGRRKNTARYGGFIPEKISGVPIYYEYEGTTSRSAGLVAKTGSQGHGKVDPAGPPRCKYGVLRPDAPFHHQMCQGCGKTYELHPATPFLKPELTHSTEFKEWAAVEREREGQWWEQKAEDGIRIFGEVRATKTEGTVREGDLISGIVVHSGPMVIALPFIPTNWKDLLEHFVGKAVEAYDLEVPATREKSENTRDQEIANRLRKWAEGKRAWHPIVQRALNEAQCAGAKLIYRYRTRNFGQPKPSPPEIL